MIIWIFNLSWGNTPHDDYLDLIDSYQGSFSRGQSQLQLDDMYSNILKVEQTIPIDDRIKVDRLIQVTESEDRMAQAFTAVATVRSNYNCFNKKSREYFIWFIKFFMLWYFFIKIYIWYLYCNMPAKNMQIKKRKKSPLINT